METLQLAIITSTCVMGLGWLCSLLFPELIVRGFTSDTELIAITSNGLRLNFTLAFFVGSQITISHFFQSIGAAWKTILLSLSRQMIFLIPALFILPPMLGLNGVWLAAPLSDGMATITAWSFLLHYMICEKKRLGL
jgi:Na+-driven multidrug efflux pump